MDFIFSYNKNCTSSVRIVRLFKTRRFTLFSPKLMFPPICRPNQVAEVESTQNYRNICLLFPSLQNAAVFTFKLFFFNFSQLQLSAFSPHPSTPPQPNPPPSPASTLHLDFVLYSSYRPHSPLSPPHYPLAIVTLFLISVSLLIICLLFTFVDYVPGKGEIIWYLSLTTWLREEEGAYTLCNSM